VQLQFTLWDPKSVTIVIVI